MFITRRFFMGFILCDLVGTVEQSASSFKIFLVMICLYKVKEVLLKFFNLVAEVFSDFLWEKLNLSMKLWMKSY